MTTNKSKTLAPLVACALMLAISMIGMATPAWSDYRQMSDEVAQFHAFMRNHPKVSTDLQANPKLVYDRKYLDKHDDVKDFLKKHPAVRDEIGQHPRRVFGRYYIDDRREYTDNRPEHRWDYRYDEHRAAPEHRYNRDRRDDREHRNDRDYREHQGNKDRH